MPATKAGGIAVISGCCNKPQAATEMLQGGSILEIWLRLSSECYVFFVARKKVMFINGGENAKLLTEVEYIGFSCQQRIP